MRNLTLTFLIVLVTSLCLPLGQRMESQTFDVRQLMTPAQFRDCGLQKLSDAEIQSLNKWFTNAIVQVAKASRETVSSQAGAKTSFADMEGAVIVADDWQFLGRITTNEFDSNSILNEFGRYGSEFSSTSIFNSFSRYGGEFSTLSPFNEFSSTPPRIFKDNKFVAYLTIGKLKQPRVDPRALVAWLKAHN